jgi:hypothetical protein
MRHGRKADLMCAKTDEPQCPVCNDTGTVTAQDTPFGGTITEREREHVTTPIYEIPCPMPDDQHKR